MPEGNENNEQEPAKGDKPDAGNEARTFTQEQVNAFLAEERRKETAKFADYADLKAKAEAHDAAVEAARSEQEKAVEAARKEGESAALEKANTRLVSAEARALAAGAGFRNAATAARLLDLTGVTVGDDGVVDAAAIKQKLDALAEAEPYLIDDGKGSRPKPDTSQGGGGGTGRPSGGSVAQVMADRAAARAGKN